MGSNAGGYILHHNKVGLRHLSSERLPKFRYILIAGGEAMQIGICDDQKEVREQIADRVRRLYPEESILFFASGQEALDAQQTIDLLFLDIQMPGINGMEAARKIRSENSRIIIIFVTAMEDYVYQAFDVGAFHYLVKPFVEEKFSEVLQNAVKQYEDRKLELYRTPEQYEDRRLGYVKENEGSPSLIVSAKGKHTTVRLKDIIYAEVYNRKMILHTIDSDLEYYGKMKELEKKAGDDFFRSHRAYLVNFDFIKKYDSGTIYLERGQALMSKQNYQEFVKRYLRYNQRKWRE